MAKIIRTICLFTDEITAQDIEKLEKISHLLKENNFFYFVLRNFGFVIHHNSIIS
ncbi:MAG: hypothetical protein V1891_04120 [bacterium]